MLVPFWDDIPLLINKKGISKKNTPQKKTPKKKKTNKRTTPPKKIGVFQGQKLGVHPINYEKNPRSGVDPLWSSHGGGTWNPKFQPGHSNNNNLRGEVMICSCFKEEKIQLVNFKVIFKRSLGASRVYFSMPATYFPTRKYRKP